MAPIDSSFEEATGTITHDPFGAGPNYDEKIRTYGTPKGARGWWTEGFPAREIELDRRRLKNHLPNQQSLVGRYVNANAVDRGLRDLSERMDGSLAEHRKSL